ncbi:Ger(x)C family spore germination protein [Brevibacillus sp. NRS-1366]|uniref:Ger(x)C family spore germination protein n=1 Tax=Brevibacillus sp. NRS-1366 TaxID=3233899 RepID=UPI003D20A3EE
MKRRWMASFLLLLSLTFVSGCWDQKSIQDLNYLSALGIDYVNNEYVLYAQSADLSTVAKQESPGTSKPPIVVSIGRGETLQGAMDNMQKNAQIPLFSGFVSTLIYHERMLKKDILPTFDILNRYGLLRYTKWVFGTKEPIAEVLSNHSITGFSPLTSLLHQPQDVYKQRSFIEPIRYYTFISRFWEPSNTVIMPNISIYTQAWKENNNYISRLTIDGVHTIYRGKWNGFFPSQDLLGLRWLNPHTEFAGLIIRENNKPKATLRILSVRVEIIPIQTGVDPRFRILVHLNGFVREIMGSVKADFIQKDAEKQIEKQIRATFLKGIKAGTDLYGLEEALYKHDLGAWKQFAKDHSRKLTADALAEVSVNVRLSDSGKMKLNWYHYPDHLLP